MVIDLHDWRRFCAVSLLGLFIAALLGCEDLGTSSSFNSKHPDIPFIQDYALKYVAPKGGILRQIGCDRNGNVKILSSEGMVHPTEASLLTDGALVPDLTYRTSRDKVIQSMTLKDGQFVYADANSIFSQAWAGSFFLKHLLPFNSKLEANGEGYAISHKHQIATYKIKNRVWLEGTLEQEVCALASLKDVFWALDAEAIYRLEEKNWIKVVILPKGLHGTDLLVESEAIWVTTDKGLLEYDTKGNLLKHHRELPAEDLLCIEEIQGDIWCGSTHGAFRFRDRGFDYYAGRRWLVNDTVTKIAAGQGSDVCLLSPTGLSVIKYEEWTLSQKAAFYEKQVRTRHIRNGFNATLSGLEGGDVHTGYLSDSDNDGLWTGMYLGGQAFRYVATLSSDALQNCREAMDALERLYTINPVPGFPSRSFERSGYMEELADPERWRKSEDPEWIWKATTSSDEAIGHIFGFGVVADIVPDEVLRAQAIRLIDTLMSHVLRNDLYLIDADGKPTTWGRWHPDYVNARPIMVGDRKLNSSNLIAMLQTAYHFTGKEKYHKKGIELMELHGYLENLMRPMDEIGQAPESADDWSRMLSEDWNHSDDEMYYMGYWGLYRYPFHDSLSVLYKLAIEDHWQKLRPAKEGAWNIFMGILGTDNYDLDEAIWYLQEYPLDLRSWTVRNSHRKDIELLDDNFIEQTTVEVLPPDELPIARHNANRFRLDGGNDGRNEYSAGDIWLLPYWMAVYLNRIEMQQ